MYKRSSLSLITGDIITDKIRKNQAVRSVSVPTYFASVDQATKAACIEL